MGIFFERVRFCVGEKKWYFLLLLALSLVVVVLAVLSAVKYGSGVITIDLSNIVFIRFLKNETGIMATIFLAIIGAVIFFVLICCCHHRAFLVPVGLVLYLYFVYSQVVVIVSVIVTYGFLNCILVVAMLILYLLVCMAVFLLLILDCLCVDRTFEYYRHCMNMRESNVIMLGVLLLVFIALFVLVLALMKSFMILLVY